jgi:hypothetical protein
VQIPVRQTKQESKTVSRLSSYLDNVEFRLLSLRGTK